MWFYIVVYCTCSARTSTSLLLASFTDLKHRTNHLTAVLCDDPVISPGTSKSLHQSPSISSTGSTTHASSIMNREPLRPTTPPDFETSNVETLKCFATKIGFHTVMADLLERMGFLHGVVDVFTHKYLPAYREEYNRRIAKIQLPEYRQEYNKRLTPL